nr:hypothetical protein GCM10020093_044740 [Planobispora longispora]
MNPLITPADLAALDGAVILDVRWKLGGPPGRDSYREGTSPARSSAT